jgi:hypothetical protein
MGARKKRQRLRRVSPERIVECINTELEINISIQSHQELISSIEKILDAYLDLKEDGIYGLFPKDPIFNKIDNAVASLEQIAPQVALLKVLNMDEGKRKNLSEEEWKDIQREQRKRQRKVNAIIRDLRGLRDWAHGISYPKVYYSQRLREAMGFISWALWETLDSHIHNRNLLDKQIDYAVFELMALRGIELKRPTNPPEAIRKRIERFLERVPPETASRILTYLIQRLPTS